MPTAVEVIKTLFSRELEATHAFMAILERETEVLLAGSEPNELADVTQTKWLRANSLQALHLESVALLSSLKKEHGSLDIIENDPEIKSLHEQLTIAFANADAKNKENGIVIQQFLKSTEEAMAVLNAAMGANDVYSADGRKVNKGGRILATT